MPGSPLAPAFTFQYVSINTEKMKTIKADMPDFTFQYVSINTDYREKESGSSFGFTFQYVSINTNLLYEAFEKDVPLHSNMFLLILNYLQILCKDLTLYIPICFY